MKTIQKLTRYAFYALCILASTGSTVKAATGCMDNSYHGCMDEGYDYKTLHYVSCSCPCNRYERLNRRGQCTQCLHYNAARDRF